MKEIEKIIYIGATTWTSYKQNGVP